MTRTTLPTIAILAMVGCAQTPSLPPAESQRYPDPEPVEDWEEWGENRSDTPPTRGGGPVQVIGERLDGEEIRRLLSGQYLRGCYPNGERFTERLATDGRFYLVGDTEEYQGRWDVDQDRLCFDYEVGENAEAPVSCFPVSQSQGELYFYAADFAGIVAATVCPSGQGS